jgi:sialate O-acetylesterase
LNLTYRFSIQPNRIVGRFMTEASLSFGSRPLIFSLAALGCTLIGAPAPCRADVFLPQLFSDHAVLQRAERVPVFGRASPQEKVVVTLGSVHAEAVAGADGQWRAALDLRAVDKGPFELVVQGNNRLTISDVVVGEVWVCGGQSNMALEVSKATGAEQEIATSANPWLRQYDNGTWIIAGPATAGDFKAVGYYFGKELQHKLNAPVGLPIALQPATAVELWISPEGMDRDKDLKAGKQRVEEMSRVFASYGPRYLQWQAKYERQDRPTHDVNAFAAPQASTADWKRIELPGLFTKSCLPDSSAAWIRRQVTIPADLANKNLLLELGNLHDFSTVYWNGVKVGQSRTGGPPDSHQYVVPANQVRAGSSTLAIRIFSAEGNAGISPGPNSFRAGGTISLAGPWLAKSEFALPPISEQAKAARPPVPQQPFPSGMFFDYAVRSKIPYAIAGVIWYQGESNTERAWQYRTAFPLMIRDWREHWGQGDFPFYWCQLPNIMPHKKTPSESQWAELRESQTKTLALPNTAEAVLIDVGEEEDIHPRNKRVVGERLARIALAETYGKKIVPVGPIFESSVVEGDKIRVHFQPSKSRLAAREIPATYQPSSSFPRTLPLVRNSPHSELEGFAICGADRQWHWAEAKIEGPDVVVWSAQVPRPVAIRYAWADNPICNLYNAEGLPAGPFRTDDFPVTTVNPRY